MYIRTPFHALGSKMRPERRHKREYDDVVRRTSSCRDIRSGQRRLDARVLGSLPLHGLGSLGPLPLLQYPRWFESTSWSGLAVRTQSLWDASPGVMSQPPWSLGRF